MNIIIDVQGFKDKNNMFIPKEIAILSERHVLILLIKPPYPFYYLTNKERVQAAWIEKNKGILWNEGYVPYSDYKYRLLEFCKNKRIHTKGYEKVNWLKNILDTDNVYNLETINCPNLDFLYKNYATSSDIQTCIYHNNICAYKNVTCLKKWCTENNVLFFNKEK